jgi:uncharacterized protein
MSGTGLRERYGPWAVVAGASEGIGAAFARALAAEGFELVLIARRAEPLAALAAELAARHGASAECVALDLGSAELETRLGEIARGREVGLVVYNAALSTVAPFLETALADKRQALAVNALGPLIAAQVFGEPMVQRGRGGLVLMSSLTAFWGSPWIATYGATKAFELALGEALAHELGQHGVDVLVSCAGATRTPGFLELVAGRKAPRSMSPDAVARETLRALPHRGAFIPGRWNRLAHRALSLLPRKTALELMADETKALMR